MDLSYEPIALQLETPFRIAHGVSETRHNVLVRLTDGACVGLGEAAPVRQHHETQADVLTYLAGVMLPGDDPFQIEAFLASLPSGSRAARAALDIALHDLVGHTLGLPLYRLWGLDPDSAPYTSFTLGIGPVDEVRERAVAAADRFPILKLKLDADEDHSLALVRAVARATRARLLVDANCAWSVDQALRLIPLLADLGVEFVEQPLPEEDLDGLRRIRSQSPVPIFADEPVRAAADIPRLADCVDGVSIKVMKAGGLREALRAIAVARAHGLQVMVSCMVETSVGITAAAHLSPLADWADLDGHLLITNDPYIGVGVEQGRLILPKGPGLGIEPRC